MAKKFIEYLVDDLDGTEIDPGKGKSVRFGFNGKSYEIDLSETNAAAFEEMIRPYVKAGRPDSGPASKSAGAKKSHRPTDEARNTAIRDWAAAQGVEMPARGRIPADVAKAYDASQRAATAA